MKVRLLGAWASAPAWPATSRRMETAARMANAAAARYGITDGLPTFDMVMDAWGLLHKHGPGRLPDKEIPGPPRRWQRRMVLFFLAHIYASFQGCRQFSGKTFVMAIIAACCLLLG